MNKIVLDNLPANSVAIIDEAHNIDDVCIEAKTIRIDNFTLNLGFQNLQSLQDFYGVKKEENFEIFKQEYERLVSQARMNSHDGDLEMAKKMEIMPGNIRKVTHFFSLIKRLLSFLRNIMRQKEVLFYQTQQFKEHLKITAHIEEQSLLFSFQRLNVLIQTLQYQKIDELIPLSTIL